MNSARPDTALLIDRLARLERSHRRLRRAAVGCLAMTGLAVLLAAGRGPVPAGEVAATRFVLQDEAGRVLARLEPVPEVGGARLVLLGKEGVSAAELQATPAGSRLSLQANGVPRADLEASIHADIARLTFRSDDRDVRLQALTESGLSSIFVNSRPNEKGVKTLLGLYMPPEPDNPPQLLLRMADLRRRIWTIQD